MQPDFYFLFYLWLAASLASNVKLNFHTENNKNKHTNVITRMATFVWIKLALHLSCSWCGGDGSGSIGIGIGIDKHVSYTDGIYKFECELFLNGIFPRRSLKASSRIKCSIQKTLTPTTSSQGIFFILSFFRDVRINFSNMWNSKWVVGVLCYAYTSKQYAQQTTKIYPNVKYLFEFSQFTNKTIGLDTEKI